MMRNFASSLAFATTVAAATAAAVIVSRNAIADEITVDNPTAAAPARTLTGPDRSHLQRTSADVLKRQYLICERAATERVLDGSSAAECSMVYEELRERIFGGNFNALNTWWHGVRGADAEARE